MLEKVFGHEKIKEELLSLKRNLPKMLLFTGPENIGKTFTAINFIEELYTKCKVFNCPDISIYEPDTKVFKLELIEDIQSKISTYPLEINKKFFILKKAHLMNSEAINASLKMFEDSPNFCHFILLSEDSSKIATTIKSRAMEFQFNYVDVSKYYPDLSESEIKLMQGCIGNYELVKNADIKKIKEKIQVLFDSLKNKEETRILEVNISEEIKQKAIQKAKEMGSLKDSITCGEGNTAGFIGEEIVASFLGTSVTNTYDYDIIYKNKKIDVKTKRCTSRPVEFYDCSIANANIEQNTDIYVFTRVLENYQKGWILGYYPKKEYFKDATFHKEGEIDSSNNFSFKADCYNLSISKLKPITELREKMPDYSVILDLVDATEDVEPFILCSILQVMFLEAGFISEYFLKGLIELKQKINTSLNFKMHLKNFLFNFLNHSAGGITCSKII